MSVTELEFPLQIKQSEEGEFIFCQVRKKYLKLTPEEWVRQHVLHLLHHQLGIGFGRIAVERQVTGSAKRFDIVIFEQETGKPLVLIECKRRKEMLTQKVFDQASRYNQKIGVPYLVITNWNQWLAAEVSTTDYKFLNGFPKV